MIVKVDDDNHQMVDVKWLRNMSDDELQNWATGVWDNSVHYNSLAIDLRDSILAVLVRHQICPMHWFADDCDIEEVYGKSRNFKKE